MTTKTELTPEELSALDDATLLAAYIQARDRKEAAKAAASRAEAVMLTLKSAINARLNERGSDGFKVDGVARVTRITQTRASMSAGEPFFQWMLEQIETRKAMEQDPLEVFAFIQRRVTVDAVKSYMADNNGLPPPGVDVSVVNDVRVTPI